MRVFIGALIAVATMGVGALIADGLEGVLPAHIVISLAAALLYWSMTEPN